MSELFAELVALLRQEIERYRHLLVLVRRERGQIVKGELAGLADVVRKKEALARELDALAQSRDCLLGRVAAELGEPANTLTLARVALLAPAEAGIPLAALLNEFRAVVGRLIAANDVNRTLLDRSLEFVRGSLELFHTVITTNPTYDASGRIEIGESALLAVNQTV